MAIPIRNIYYLLSYAWNRLEESERVSVDIDDRTELLDLFAKILINATRILIKRGIDKNYVEVTREFSGVKGKLQLSETVERNSLLRSRTVCSFDRYSANILINQILVSTLWRLIKTRGLDSELKSGLKALISKLGGIERIDVRNSHFKSVKIHRNNKFYRFVMDVCRLVHENTLPSEEHGIFEFSDFTRDERKMNQLFERFIFHFYRIESSFNVRRETINWKFESADAYHLDFLPKMETDITLENPERKIIIDAKYYKETLGLFYEARKIRSANLYQLFSYVLNQRSDDYRSLVAEGILLYPTIDLELDLEYVYENHPIQIKTVNLNRPWRQIDQRLREIVV